MAVRTQVNNKRTYPRYDLVVAPYTSTANTTVKLQKLIKIDKFKYYSVNIFCIKRNYIITKRTLCNLCGHSEN